MEDNIQNISLEVISSSALVYNGRRYVQGTQLSLGPITATGTSAAKAKVTMADTVRSFVSAYRDPKTVSLDGYTAVIYVTPGENGPFFGYFIINLDGNAGCHTTQAGSFEEAEISARMAIANDVVDYHDDESVHHCANFLPERGVGSNSSPRKEFKRYCQWQRAALHGQELGLDADAAHDYACKHEHDPEFAIGEVTPDLS